MKKKHEKKVNPSTSLRMTLSGIERVKIIIFFTFSFLIFNLFYSQSVSPLYSQFVNENKKAVVEYLKKIKNLPSFNTQLFIFENIYDNQLKQDVFQEENGRNLQIKKLEQVLQINPKARDVLYGLYQLYLEKGDKITAGKYLKQAKEVDPDVK